MKCLGGATCTVHLTPAQTNQKGIEGTYQKSSYLGSYCLIYTLCSQHARAQYVLLRCFAACPRAKVFMGAYKSRIQMAGHPRAAQSRLPEQPLIPCSVSSLKSARNTCGVIRVLGQLSGLDICSQFKKLTVFNFVLTLCCIYLCAGAILGWKPG